MPKPVKKKKRFIIKKESTTYTLVPGYVPDEDPELPSNETPEEIAARKEEERKYGVFFDDAYNYMKHLRPQNETAGMVNVDMYKLAAEDETQSLPSHPPVFFEMFSGEKDAGQSIDPEILAALDEAPEVDMKELEKEGEADLDSFLDDDFISQAGGVAPKPEPASDEEEEEEEWSDDEEGDSDFGVSDDDTGSDSMSYIHQGEGRGTVQDEIAEAQTALILRNFEEGLGLRCSNMVEEDEPENHTGADDEYMKYMIEQDIKDSKQVSWSEVLDDQKDKPKIDTSKYLYEDEDEIVWVDAPKSKPKFDCVSILSLNSNTRNLPTDILPPSSKTKKPKENASETNADRGLSLRELEQEMQESRRAERADRVSTLRPQGESAEEKRLRKKAVKEERKERRVEKKANKQVFSVESQKLQKETAALAKSVKSVKIC